MHAAMGMAYAAFVIDVFARKTVGWCVSTLMTASFVLDAPDQAIRQRRPALGSSTHRLDRGMLCLSIRYAERLAETVIGLFKAEIVKHLGLRKTTGQLEWETMKWVRWNNKDRLHGAVGCQIPNEKESGFRQ